MRKKGKVYIILVVLTILSIVYLEYSKPQELNWYPSYAKHHKIPFGTYVLHNQMERLFDEEQIMQINQPPFQFLFDNDDVQGTYVFINDNINFGKAELERLLHWTSNGNTLFLASLDFEELLLDTLNLKTEIIRSFSNFNQDYVIQLKNEKLNNDTFNFDKASNLFYFNDIENDDVKVVGVIDNRSAETDQIGNEHYNVLKIPFEDGEIILSSFPQAFTNYFILKDNNRNYTAGLLSYIDPSRTIFIDQHYKTGKSYYTSPLYILLNTKELKWAYYLLLIGAFLYVFFEGKRKQRAIPIVKPLRNQTLDFTRTIANMYYEKGNHRTMAMHKIRHFTDFIRVHWHLNANSVDENLLKQLSARSGNDLIATQELFNLIKQLQNKPDITQSELELLSNLIDDYKQQ